MVNVERGILLTVDKPIKQFIIHLDEYKSFHGRKFILKGKKSRKKIKNKNYFTLDLDETHLFVTADCKDFLKEKLAELMNDNSFPIGLDTV